MREPRFEGVNYAGYTRKSSVQVDRALQKLGKIDRRERAERHGELVRMGADMRIEIEMDRMTIQWAREVGETIKAVARAVE